MLHLQMQPPLMNDTDSVLLIPTTPRPSLVHSICHNAQRPMSWKAFNLLRKDMCVCENLQKEIAFLVPRSAIVDSYTHTHTHIYIYIYTYLPQKIRGH